MSEKDYPLVVTWYDFEHRYHWCGFYRWDKAMDYLTALYNRGYTATLL